MNRSLPGCRGSFGSNRISAKKSAATRSAAEQQLVGCPVPLSEVDVIESIRSCVAAFFKAGMSDERSIGIWRWGRFQIADFRFQISGFRFQILFQIDRKSEIARP